MTAAVSDGRVGPAPTGSSMDQVLKLVRYQFRDYLRSRRYVLMMTIVGAIGLILTAVVAYFRPDGVVNDPNGFYGTLWGGGAGAVIIFAGIIFGGDAIAGEFQNKTGYFLMGLPIRRSTIYVGKYLAALAASFTALVVYLLILFANGVYYLGGNAFPGAIAPAFLLAFVYLLALLGTTFLFSSLFKTSAYSILVVAVLFLFVFSILETVLTDLVKIEPWMLISYASGAIGDVFAPSVNWGLTATVVTTHIPTAGGGMITNTTYTPGVAEGVVIMLVYFVATSVLGLLLFEREEFT